MNKIYSKTSSAIFAYLLFILFGSITPILFNPDRSVGLQYSDANNYSFYLFYFLIAVLSSSSIFYFLAKERRGINAGIFDLGIISLLAYIGFVLCSASWDGYLTETYKFYVVSISTIALMIIYTITFGNDWLVDTILVVGRLSLLLSIFVVIFAPGVGIHQGSDLHEAILSGSWRGSFIHKNALGHFAAMFLFFELAVKGTSKPRFTYFDILFLILALVCVAFARSAGAYLATTICATLYVAARFVTPRNAHILLIACGVVLAIVYFGSNVVLGILGKDSTYTGRTEIWRYWFDIASSKFLFGHGAFANYAKIEQQIAAARVQISAGNPHNGYIDILYGQGIIGSALFFFVAVTASLRAFAIKSYGYLILILCAAVLAGSDVNSFRTVFGFGFLILALIPLTSRRPMVTKLGKKRRKIATAKAA